MVLKGRMTAMELLTAARTLHDLSVELNKPFGQGLRAVRRLRRRR